MKVLHVLNSRIFSGAEKVACQIIQSFQGEVEMVYCSPESPLLTQSLKEQGVRYVPIPELTPGNLRQVIGREKPDCIHAHDMRASFVAALCCGKIPLISHIHNNAFNARGLSPKSVAYLLAGWKAEKILWVSRSSFEGYRFHKLFAGKSQILYNIIDEAQVFQKASQDENHYDFDMIYIGRLTYQKDPQRLMGLIARVKQSKPDLKAAVVGTGELEAQTKALAQELGLQDTVSFLGFQSNPMKMLRDSGVLVLTSRWEGTPMCALEAMALGVPVVSTPSDGLAELVENGENGWLCATDQELAEKILKILQEPGCRQTLSDNTVRRFAAINDSDHYHQAIAACYGLGGQV